MASSIAPGIMKVIRNDPLLLPLYTRPQKLWSHPFSWSRIGPGDEKCGDFPSALEEVKKNGEKSFAKNKGEGKSKKGA